MKERDLFIPARKISAADTSEIKKPIKGQTDTKARIIDLFINKSLGLEASSLYISDITTNVEFAAALVKHLVDSHRIRPLQAPEYFISALFEVIADESIEEADRKKFLDTALDEYVDVIVRLDRLAFPAFDILYKGIPEYLPDGLSDWGHYPIADPLKRPREKIRIKKLEVHQDHKDFLIELLWFLQENTIFPQTVAWAETVFYEVLNYVHDEMPYDYTFSAAIPKNRSVSLREFSKKKHKALCRHQALLVQVLLQILAVNSRLYRCDVWNVTAAQGGRHVANTAEIGPHWWLGDATAPEQDLINIYEKVPFIRRMPGSIDDIPAEMTFTKMQLDQGLAKLIKVRYTTIKNMYYKIRDNEKDVW